MTCAGLYHKKIYFVCWKSSNRFARFSCRSYFFIFQLNTHYIACGHFSPLPYMQPLQDLSSTTFHKRSSLVWSCCVLFTQCQSWCFGRWLQSHWRVKKSFVTNVGTHVRCKWVTRRLEKWVPTWIYWIDACGTFKAVKLANSKEVQLNAAVVS